MKLVVYLVTFIVCIAILIGAAVLTVQSNDFSGFIADINEALKKEEIIDNVPPSPNPDDEKPNPDTKPGEGTGSEEGGEDEKDPEKEAEELKELFGMLYSQYTPVTQDVQESAMKNIIESNMDISNKTSKAYLTFVDAYTEALYKEIAERKGDGEVDPNSPEELEKEKSFVDTEAPAYDCFVDIMSGVVSDKKEYAPSTEEINESVETMIQSIVCKNTLDTVTQDASLVSTTQKGMKSVDPRVVSDIENALNEHLNDNELSEEVCRGLAELFGITLK